MNMNNKEIVSRGGVAVIKGVVLLKTINAYDGHWGSIGGETGKNILYLNIVNMAICHQKNQLQLA